MAWLLKSVHIDPYEKSWQSPYIACYQDEDVARAELAEIKDEIVRFGVFGFIKINGNKVTVRIPLDTPYYTETAFESKLHMWFSDGRYRRPFFDTLILIAVPSR